MHIHHLDAFEFDAALCTSLVMHKWPATADAAARYAVRHAGRDAFLLPHASGSGGVLIEPTAGDETSTHDMIRDTQKRGLL